MIEQQLRDGLRAAVTAEPPLGFDPDDLVTRTSRTAHRRRTTFAAVAAAAVVVAGTVSAVAATGGLSGGDQHFPVAGPQAPTPAQAAAKRLGNSLVDALSDLGPDGEQFEVSAAGPQHHGVAGVVVVRDGPSSQAIGFAVTTTERCTRCAEKGVGYHEGNGTRTVAIRRDGVALTLSTATSLRGVDSELGTSFSDEPPCECATRTEDLLRAQQLQLIVSDQRLALPDPAVVDRVERQWELTQQERALAEKEAKLEREIEAAKREAELEHRQEQLEQEQEELERQQRESAEPGGK